MNDKSPSAVSPALSQNAPHRPWLVADIGGTNARFGWVGEGSDEVQHVTTLRSAEHASPAAAARHYLTGLSTRLGPAYVPPCAGAFAVATAVGGDTVVFTNSGWSFSQQATRRELGLSDLLILNDFEALALSLPRLRSKQLNPIGTALATAVPGALAVIGPGTGLGVAGIVPTAHGWVALGTEGGHTSFSPRDEREIAILRHGLKQYPHLSHERLLSGPGMELVHRALRDHAGLPAQALAAPEITRRALDGSCAVCAETLEAFCAMLGTMAANLAVTLGALGGIYIGGGIVPRFGPRFFESRFRERFEAKGRFQPYLAAIPTALITDTLAALTGAVLALEQHGR